MITIPGYHNLTQLYESTSSLIYRGLCNNHNESFILKILKAEYPTLAELTCYQQEYEITRRLNLPEVVKVYKLEKFQNTLVMTVEDFGGQSLKLLMSERTFSLTELLSLVITIIDIVGKIHVAQIIHKNLNPSNILLNVTTGQIKFIDFGIASILPREKPVINNPDQLEGTLAYMSPEQTGRMNRAIDYRTDYYALGVTFYELLTHRLPFETTDALELVYCHLAKQPLPPHALNPNIPPMISDLVMKLLAKMAEERYQSTWGIKSDLTTCLSQLQTTGRVENFSLGRQDVAQTLPLSQKLYGREEEVRTLLMTFEEVSQGLSKVMLITGYSGIGKTVLVQEIYKPLTQKRGYFMAGKFDPLQRNVPYSAIVCAFRELVRQLLTESEAQLARWQARLSAALGPNAQVIIEVIPEVALIVGQQPPVQTLEPQETQNRFNLVFHNFLKVFCQPEHPLVIFLDDLQWADSASLRLMIQMMTNSHYLFLIGAYRDNEVNAAHPLLLTVAELQQVGNSVQTLLLSPLNFFQITQFLTDTCQNTSAAVESLATLMLEKTKGNPFFMSEFLKSLYIEKLLTFTPPSATDQGGWQWDLVKIHACNLCDNVIDLMIHKVQKLKRRTQRVLKLAACIGSRFNLLTLATVSALSPLQTAAALWQAVIEGLITAPPRAAFLNSEAVAQLETTTLEYQFAHDRIRQAIYSLIPPEEKHTVHWQVGQLLLDKTPTEQREQQIFAIVDQLNLGRELTHSQLNRDELASLNLIAGRKAKTAAAYQPACSYLQIGLELLGENCWQQQYELTLALYVENIEIAYINGDFERLEQLATVVLQSANTLLDKVKVYEIQIQTAITRNHSSEAVKMALPVLNWLGVKLPPQPHQGQRLLRLLWLKLRLRGKRIRDLENLPPMKDPVKQATMRILTSVAHAAYTAAPKLFPLVVFQMVLLSIKHGSTSESPLAYSLYGLVLCGNLGEIETGYQFGMLALRTVEQLQAKSFEARTMYMVNGLIKHWQRPVQEILSPLLETYQRGLESGNLEYAASPLYTYTYYAFLSGKNLSELALEMATYHKTLCQLKQETILRRYPVYWQVVLNLKGHTDNPRRLVGEVCNEEEMLIRYLETKDRGAIFHLYFNRLILSYLFGEYSQAVANAFMAEQHLDGVTALLVVPVFHFYDSLAYLAVFHQIRLVKRPRVLKKITANQKKLQKWAHHAPMNHLHKFYLVEAELNRVLGKEQEARDYYDQAIAFAHQHNYLNEEALAYELTGKFYWGRRQTQLASHYLRHAHYTYSRWGALAKVEELETQYEQIFSKLESFPGAMVTVGATPENSKRYAELRDREQRVQQFLEAMPVGIGVLDARGKLYYINHRAQQLLGKDVVPTVTADTFAAVYQIYIAGRQQYYPFEQIILAKIWRGEMSTADNLEIHQGSQTIPIEIWGAPVFDDQGNITYAIVVFQDITARKHAAAELEQFTKDLFQLNQAYERFVPREFLSLLDKHSVMEVQLGDPVEKEMTILFADVRDFTALSERMTPQENFDFINAYLSKMAPIIAQYHGFIDQYVGDAIMALFPTSADDAVGGAIAMLKTLADYNRESQQLIRIGIGLNTGLLMLGTVGDANRMDGTIISDAVSLASRIEGLTKIYDTALLISEHTYSRLPEASKYAIRIIDRVKVKDKFAPVTVYEVFDGDSPAVVALKRQTLADFEQALFLYRHQQFGAAQHYFEQMLHVYSDDRVAQIYLQRCQHFQQYGVSGEWMGAEELESK